MYDPRAHILLKKILSDTSYSIDREDDFWLRLVANFHDLYYRFEKLYGGVPGFEESLQDLIRVLLRKYEARPAELKSRDRDREEHPGWFLSENITGMMLYVDRFSDDLAGFVPKIPYLQELGISLVHLMPLLQSPKDKNDGGYAVSDYRKIDSRYGTNEDLLKVVAHLHQHNMLVMTDLVINHTSSEHLWAQQARKGDRQYQGYYYTFKERTVPDLFERSMPEIFPTSSPGNFTFSKEMDRWVMTVFHDYQWDLNYTNPTVLIEMIDVLLSQANWGIDIFRLDAVAFIWKQLDTLSQNLPQAHCILQLYKLCVQVVAPGVALLAEAIVAPGEIVKYFGSTTTCSNECDMAYNATMMALLWDSVATHNTKVLHAGLRAMAVKPKGTTWINYARCHDDIGLGYTDQDIHTAGYTPYDHRKFILDFLTGRFKDSFAKGLTFMFNPKNGDARISGSLASLAGLEYALEEKDEQQVEFAIRRIILLHAIMLSYGGIPMLYYGDELATLNDYTFFKEEERQDDNRWVHRPKIDWGRAEQRKKRGTPEHAVFSALKRMIKIRSNTEEWADQNNTQVIETGNEYLFAFTRLGTNASTLTIANFKDKTQIISANWVADQNFPLDHLWDKYSGRKVTFKGANLHLAPYKFLWLTNKNPRLPVNS
ncbi:MAG: alpha-amylase family protein [Cytophagales bacterium]|nr:alpha-amylase family protein [Cytophagales bacterium]